MQNLIVDNSKPPKTGALTNCTSNASVKASNFQRNRLLVNLPCTLLNFTYKSALSNLFCIHVIFCSR